MVSLLDKSTALDPVAKKRIFKSDFFIVPYEAEFFPGKVTDIQNNWFLVSVMIRSGTYWKCPKKKGELFYEKEDTKERIAESLQKITRGAYSVPEIAKYFKYIQ